MSLIKDYKGPKRYELFEVTLKIIEELGSSGRIDEIYEKILDFLNLPNEIIEYPHGIGNTSYATELEYKKQNGPRLIA